MRNVRTFQTIREVPSYRWYLLSMIGNMSAMQMQMISRGILTYQLTGSYAALGTIELANTLPRLVFALTGGVVADRQNRRTITQLGQTFNAFVAATLAALLFADMLTFTHLVIGSVLSGISNSFGLPARQAMIPQIVGMERLSNALGLNASMMSVLRLVAPGIAAAVIAVVGASWVFALMAFLYLFATLVLFRVRMLPIPETEVVARVASAQKGNAIADIVDALRYIMQIPVLRTLLIVDMFLGMLMFPYQRLLPGFVTDNLASNDSEAAINLGILLTLARSAYGLWSDGAAGAEQHPDPVHGFEYLPGAREQRDVVRGRHRGTGDLRDRDPGVDRGGTDCAGCDSHDVARAGGVDVVRDALVSGGCSKGGAPSDYLSCT